MSGVFEQLLGCKQGLRAMKLVWVVWLVFRLWLVQLSTGFVCFDESWLSWFQLFVRGTRRCSSDNRRISASHVHNDAKYKHYDPYQIASSESDFPVIVAELQDQIVTLLGREVPDLNLGLQYLSPQFYCNFHHSARGSAKWVSYSAYLVTLPSFEHEDHHNIWHRMDCMQPSPELTS